MRLEEFKTEIIDGNLVGFNSLLVRLEVHAAYTEEPKSIVSIPYWCDWKTDAMPFV